jgi:hypothetical protein
MATQTVGAPAEDTPQTLHDRIDAAEQELGKAEAVLARLGAVQRALPARYHAALEEADADGLIALRHKVIEVGEKRRAAAVVAARAEVALRELEHEATRAALAQTKAQEKALEPPPGVFLAETGRERGLAAQAAAKRAATDQAWQAAADHLEVARQRLAAALSMTLD